MNKNFYLVKKIIKLSIVVNFLDTASILNSIVIVIVRSESEPEQDRVFEGWGCG